MKKIILVAMLAISVLIFVSCGTDTGESFPQASSPSQLTQPTPAPQQDAAQPVIPDYDSGEYDPSSEGDPFGDDYFGEDTAYATATPAPSPVVINSQYAGATPLAIDPIDKPTPTAAPSVTLSSSDFTTYDATRLRISFDAPSGWDVDDSNANTFILTNPDPRMAYHGQIMMTVTSVSTSYSENDLKREVRNVRDSIKGSYNDFNPSNTASRTLFDAKGIYLDFTGTLKGTEVQVWGRIQAVCVNRNLVIVQITGPREYRALYKDTIYPKFRSSVRFTR